MNITLDIETIPTQDPKVIAEIAASIQPPGNMSKPETIAAWEREKKPAAIAEAVHRTSLDGALGEIVVIGWAIDGEDPVSLSREPGTTRDLMLREFFDSVLDDLRVNEDITWIGHNVRDFDLRFLYQQAVILDVEPPFALPHNARPGDPRVYDTMTEWAGYRDHISLDRLCHALGLPGKPEGMTGAQVWDYVQAGRLDEVAAYCKNDVAQTREVWRRMTFGGL
jgi:hypothetical protein